MDESNRTGRNLARALHRGVPILMSAPNRSDSAAPLLEIRDLTKRFPGVLALDAVNLCLERGSVHAICGENGAGKSTLMNLLMGIDSRDRGEILIDGRPVQFVNPKQALAAGISIIEQELNPVPEMTVAENMFLGRESTRFGLWVDARAAQEKARQILASLGIELNPRLKMKELSLAQIQLVEIGKALSYDSEILIMDEPTSAIAEKDADRLLDLVKSLRDQGKGILYVSHRMNEIFRVADTITVFRDGRCVSTQLASETNRPEVVSLMIGRKLEDEYTKNNRIQPEVALSVRGLSRGDDFHDISLEVHAGEIYGIFGLMGSGRSEFFDALFGVEPADEGEICLFGDRCEHRRPKDAMANGMALVTEDRKKSGLVLSSSVRDNVALPNLRQLSCGPLILEGREKDAVQRITDRFRLKTPSLRQIVSRLSGGNQQKVVLAKWLLRSPRILLLDEPTRGIDIGAKGEIYSFMSEYANEGHAILLISSELPEIIAMSDRILVFSNGRAVGECSQAEARQEELLRLASLSVHEGEVLHA